MLDEILLQERLNLFKPEPLVDYECPETREDIEISMVVEDDKNIDLAKANYLNILNNEEVKKTSEDVVRKYGIGTCGPRAFYGTTDVHLELEERLAEFLGMEETIVYSYGFVAISSSIAAYCKAKDVVFLDKHANFPIMQGMAAARSKVVYFDHNNPQSLREAATKVALEEKAKKPARKFLIVEAVSWKTGQVCPLQEFLTVAEDFKMRVFLEETYSLGVFGATGRGLLEHFQVDPTRVDMVFGTLEAAVGSIGGYCAGSKQTIEHQRLSGNGYIFSASLPTYLAQAVLKSMEIMGDNPKKLRLFARDFHDFLENSCQYQVESDPECPFKVFSVKNGKNQRERELKVHEFCRENGVHFIARESGLMLNLNVALQEDESRLQLVYDVLKKASNL